MRVEGGRFVYVITCCCCCCCCETDSNVYGMESMRFVVLVFASSLGLRWTRTRMFVSSANFASRTLPDGKESVEMECLARSFDRECVFGVCRRRWMWRVDGEVGFEKAM